MFKHIVMWKFKDEADGATRESNLRTAKHLLDALPSVIPEIEMFEVGIDCSQTPSSFDLVLNSTFANRAALEAYQNHPEHRKVVEFLRRAQSAKVVVDYEL